MIGLLLENPNAHIELSDLGLKPTMFKSRQRRDIYFYLQRQFLTARNPSFAEMIEELKGKKVINSCLELLDSTIVLTDLRIEYIRDDIKSNWVKTPEPVQTTEPEVSTGLPF